MSIHETKREIKARETKEAILKAATDLFNEYGSEKVSMRDIAAEAKVTTGALYHHFPSKESLMEIIGVDRKSSLEQLAERARQRGNSIENIMAFVELVLKDEIEAGGKDLRKYRLRNRMVRGDDTAPVPTSMNPLPPMIRSFVEAAQKDNMLDPLWDSMTISHNILIEMWGIHYDYSVSENGIDIAAAVKSRLALILRAFIPGTYETKDWWKS